MVSDDFDAKIAPHLLEVTNCLVFSAQTIKGFAAFEMSELFPFLPRTTTRCPRYSCCEGSKGLFVATIVEKTESLIKKHPGNIVAKIQCLFEIGIRAGAVIQLLASDAASKVSCSKLPGSDIVMLGQHSDDVIGLSHGFLRPPIHILKIG